MNILSNYDVIYEINKYTTRGFRFSRSFKCFPINNIYVYRSNKEFYLNRICNLSKKMVSAIPVPYYWEEKVTESDIIYIFSIYNDLKEDKYIFDWDYIINRMIEISFDLKMKYHIFFKLYKYVGDINYNRDSFDYRIHYVELYREQYHKKNIEIRNIHCSDAIVNMTILYMCENDYTADLYRIFKFLLTNPKVNLNLYDKHESTLLFRIIEYNEYKALEMILQRDDLDINITKNAREFPLVECIYKKDYKMIDMFLKDWRLDLDYAVCVFPSQSEPWAVSILDELEGEDKDMIDYIISKTGYDDLHERIKNHDINKLEENINYLSRYEIYWHNVREWYKSII